MNTARLVVLIPAYNEAGSIADTLTAALTQTRPADHIVVIPNGCTDDTATIARRFPVTVMELPKLAHRKSEALNRAWAAHGTDADMIVCLDADTVLPPNAFADWEKELLADPNVGASSSKFTAQGAGFLGRLQKSEYAAWADLCLQRGSTRVVSGTGSALNGHALQRVAALEDSGQPWSYASAVEDYRLTLRLRELGYSCHVSPTVRAYTDSMKDLRSLWAQRVKWAGGTVQDLLAFGVNRLTWQDWGVQAVGLVNVLVVALSLLLTAALIVFGGLSFVWAWALLPALLAAVEVRKGFRIPHWDWWDIALAASLAPTIFFVWFRAALFAASWAGVIKSTITRTHTDLWEKQAIAEGV